jgi:phosphatidate cytidylyltransferase
VEFAGLGPTRGRFEFVILGAASILLVLASAFYGHGWLSPVLVLVLLGASTVVLLRSPIQEASGHWAWMLAGVLYLGVTLGHFVGLRQQPMGTQWVLFLLLTTFACDTAAFLVGRRWGRRKMAYTISPGKTWEGAGSGLAASVVLGPALVWVLGLPVPWWQGIVMGGLVGIVGQLGDLTESALKRGAQVKDAGAFLPGHGGILDRIDSLLFNVVVLYYYVLWIGA